MHGSLMPVHLEKVGNGIAAQKLWVCGQNLPIGWLSRLGWLISGSRSVFVIFSLLVKACQSPGDTPSLEAQREAGSLTACFLDLSSRKALGCPHWRGS